MSRVYSLFSNSTLTAVLSYWKLNEVLVAPSAGRERSQKIKLVVKSGNELRTYFRLVHLSFFIIEVCVYTHFSLDDFLCDILLKLFIAVCGAGVYKHDNFTGRRDMKYEN